MDDYKKLVDRLRDEPKDSRKASLSILDLCVEAAAEIENLEEMLKESEAARAELGKHLAATQKELHEAKSELDKYRKAEQDGRLVVLPCNVGDKVYQIDAERVYESEVKWIIFDCDDIAFDERAIGGSIFLTREEAEEALKGGEG